MTKLAILSTQLNINSDFVLVEYSLGDNVRTVAVNLENLDYSSPTSVHNAVRDLLEHQHFNARAMAFDDIVMTHADSDHHIIFEAVVEPKGPPRFAEFLFQLLAPKRTVKAQVGDLQELFDKNCARFGKRRARLMYWAQVLRAVGPGFWRGIKKLGLIGILIDYGRSKMGF